MNDIEVAKRAHDLGVRSVPAVTVNGKLAACCSGAGVEEKALRAAGLGQALIRRPASNCGLSPSIPILLGALAMGWLENLSELSRFHKGFEAIGGILLIASGLYLLNAYLMHIPDLAA